MKGGYWSRMSDMTNGQLENSKVAIVRWLKIAAQIFPIGSFIL